MPLLKNLKTDLPKWEKILSLWMGQLIIRDKFPFN